MATGSTFFSSVLAVTILVCFATAGAWQEPHLGAAIDCKSLPLKYCLADIGCEIGKENKSTAICIPSKDPPAMNCTEQIAKVGGVVSDASKTYTIALKTSKDNANILSKNASSAIDILGSGASKYDGALVKYNQSLIKYVAMQGQMKILVGQLDALKATCAVTDPPPPVTCPLDIEKLEEKVTALNMTIAKSWIDVDTANSLVNVCKTMMVDAEKATEAQVSLTASMFGAMTSDLKTSMNAKNDALAYWSVVNAACNSGAGPPTGRKVKASAGKREVRNAHVASKKQHLTALASKIRRQAKLIQ